MSRQEKQITYNNIENVTFNDTRSSETIFRNSRIEMHHLIISNLKLKNQILKWCNNYLLKIYYFIYNIIYIYIYKLETHIFYLSLSFFEDKSNVI